tara:strand:- start:69 stop:458 length:390 start_codon:yes stop_codon:yes gene_type:complete
MTFNINEHIAQMTDEQKERLNAVKQKQLELGMNPRSDSILAYNYAIEKVPKYLDDSNIIAKELVIVDYIYKNTDYSEIIEDVMREVAGFVKHYYKLDWNTTWEIVRFYVPDMLKLYCIKKHNIKIPDMN